MWANQGVQSLSSKKEENKSPRQTGLAGLGFELGSTGTSLLALQQQLWGRNLHPRLVFPGSFTKIQTSPFVLQKSSFLNSMQQAGFGVLPTHH